MKSGTAGGPYKVPKDENGLRSLGMAAAMHAGLLLFLWIGVSWQNNEPVAVEAEVWDMSVQQAAPAAKPPEPEPEPEPRPEPTPAPPPPRPVAPPVEAPPPAKDPDIALAKRKAKEKAEKEKVAEEKRLAKLKQEQEEEDKARKLAEKKAKELEQKKLDEKKLAEEKSREEKKQAEKLAKAKAEAEQKKLDKQREAEMKRMANVLGTGTAGATGTAAKSTGPRTDAGYQAAIRAKVQGNISYSGSKQDVEAVFRVTQLPTGEIISVRKVKSSGNSTYDTAVENAINRSSPLPKKKDGSVDRELELVFNLKDMP
ncbi:cell envelope integrity protein TolA [Pseudoduganella namucuonensis]|nr:cell envelope integrity protein TolA [Pseudoduganella namucuonensis]